MEKYKGWKACNVKTINSQYADSMVLVVEGNDVYKMSTDVILQMMNWFEFDVEPARKYKHLTNPSLVEDTH
jgi:hypothetical protein